ncbi:MAG: carbohydrate kinase family protein [Acidimicrobiales bacterium]
MAEAAGGTGPVSVHVVGTVFLDLVFSPVESPPRAGTEVRAGSLATSPGGVANTAVSLARLGARVSLSALFSDDAFGCYLWSTLAAEGIDLSASRRVPGWSTPVTVSMADGDERALLTHEPCHPIAEEELVPEPLRAGSLFLAPGPGADLSWVSRLCPRPRVYLDVGWDHDGQRPGRVLEQLRFVDVVLPNALEAMAYTGSGDVVGAAKALHARGPAAVVKLGPKGAIAAGAGSARAGPAGARPAGAGPAGSGAAAPGAGVVTARGVPVEAVDPTGAGDVFDAGFVYAAAVGLGIEHQLAFGNLCAALSVRYLGGALASPCWRDIVAWWAGVESPALRERYAFLDVLLPVTCTTVACHRACATFGLDEAQAFLSASAGLA